MREADKYRDISRYRKSTPAKSNLKLGSSKEVASHARQNTQSKSIADNNLSYKKEQYSKHSAQKYSHKNISKNKRAKKRRTAIKGITLAVIVIIVGIAAFKFWPIKVQINNQEITLSYDKTLQQAIAESDIKVKPGNFVAVDYSIIKANEGYEFYAEVNGKSVDNMAYKLRNGDQIKYEDGHDLMEEYDSDDSNIIAKSEIKGVGAIHRLEGTGQPGIWSDMKGRVSGKYAERQTKDPDNVTCYQYNINPGKDKVIALTFDDGPSDEYTQDILDLLKEYNAHATFFVIGERLEESWSVNLLKKEEAAGHQICSHTYDHARSAGGVDITVMTAEKQIEEVTKGKAAIKRALGHDASTVVRLPGGNLNPITCRLIAPYVSAEIGWNIDTGDWQMPGEEKILSNMKLASSGDVILCHDGGGDRNQTIKALKDFLYEYTNKGYKFITIDELMEYDAAKQTSE